MPSPPLVKAITRNGRTALAAAAIFHIVVTLSIFCAGWFALAPQKFDRDGIGQFARDSHDHKLLVDLLVNTLKAGDVGSWVNSNDAFHVKLDSLSVLVLGPLVGSNIVAVEPVNVLCYLAILVLTFTLTKALGGERAAWLAAVVVACWPSLLMHTTQFLRDPLLIVGVLAIAAVLFAILKQQLKWLPAAGVMVAGAFGIYLVWHTRPEMWLVITAIVSTSFLLLLIKLVTARKLLAANLVAMVIMVILPFAMPRPAAGVVSQPLTSDSVSAAETTAPSIVRRIAIARDKFIIQSQLESGSIIDKNVAFNSWRDVIRYIPRAFEIGYLAPFPVMWFKTGSNVGLTGRMISALEMLLTYLLELFAAIFLWRHRKDLSVWLLVIAMTIGMLAIGLVVANIGALYRMRYPFGILLLIIGAAALIDFYERLRPVKRALA
ncbi:MAG TPA: hypothetical protein VE961_20510 [Pyrinomonadaceae bacterium]|nr:hypothetical protein [Pyrinomonadaceae bacterium]